MTASVKDGRAGNSRDRTNTLLKQAEADRPLKPKQKKAVQLLCAGLSPKCVADSLGITQSSLAAWRRQPAFKWAVSDEMQIDAELHGVRLKHIYGKALERVDALLDDKNPHIRLQACRLAFEAEQNIARVIEEQEMLKSLEARLEQLANTAIHGHTPMNETLDAEIISTDDESVV